MLTRVFHLTTSYRCRTNLDRMSMYYDGTNWRGVVSTVADGIAMWYRALHRGTPNKRAKTVAASRCHSVQVMLATALCI